MNHKELCERAEKWVLSNGCSVATSEIVSGSGQQPDAIGFKDWGGTSYLIECKVSRSDFFADMKKPHMQSPEKSVGDYRWYMTPKGLVQIDELPFGWGLLELSNNRVSVIKGSMTPPKSKWDNKLKTIVETWRHPAGQAHKFESKHVRNERCILFSLARRNQVAV